MRFSYPKGAEIGVEPLGTKAPAFLFRDSETGARFWFGAREESLIG